MAVYEFSGVGRLVVQRHGEDHDNTAHGIRYIWRFKGIDSNGFTVGRSWSSIPGYWGEDKIVAEGLSHMNDIADDEYQTGTEWGLWSHDIAEGEDETAAMYRVDGVSHYREVPFTYDPDSSTFATLDDAESAFKRQVPCPSEGYFWDLYPNDSDECTHRLVMGPRGGVARRKH